MGRKREINIESREENTRVIRISLSQLSMVKISHKLALLSKANPKGFIQNPRTILVQHKNCINTNIIASEKKENSNPTRTRNKIRKENYQNHH